MAMIGINHPFEKNSVIMNQFRINGFVAELINRTDLNRVLENLEGIVLYAIEDHESILEWIIDIRKQSSVSIWVCVPRKKTKVQSLLYLHLGVDSVFEADELEEMMFIMKRTLSGQESLASSKKETLVKLVPEILSVEVDKNEVPLTRLEYCLFSLLLDNVGDVINYETLKASVWGESNRSDTNAQLANLIASLRNKLKHYQKELTIKTIRTKGYSLIL